MRATLVWTGLVQLSFLFTAAAQLPPMPEKAEGDAQPKPRLYVAQRTYDLGPIIEGDTRTVQWTLENRGDAELIIERTRAGCGCTVVKLTEAQKVIPPGGSLALTAEFRSVGRRGDQTKSVIVYSNDPVEPTLKLQFTARINVLYTFTPPGVFHLRTVRRNEPVTKSIEILPTADYDKVELLDVQFPAGAPLSYEHEAYESGGKRGERIRFIVDQSVSLGKLSTHAVIKFAVDGVERERIVPIRGQVVGELTWTPRTLDATRQAAPRGQRFAPVSVESTNNAAFDILSAAAGPLFDVVFKPTPGAAERTKYTVLLTLRDDAPTGPFGTTLEIRTSLPDQPLLRIPAFGIVAPLIDVDPPVILLRQDGTPAGTHRRVKLRVLPQVKLDVSSVACDNEAVETAIDRESSSRYQHLRFIDVKLTGEVPPGVHHAVLTITTNIKGAERLEIPVAVEAPGGRG